MCKTVMALNGRLRRGGKSILLFSLLAIASATWLAQASSPAPQNVGPPRGLGISLAGAEFGSDRVDFSNQNPGALGTEYTYPERKTVRMLAERGFRLFRLPVRWERLQPELNGPLNATELARLDRVIADIADTQSQAIVDLHNYGRYRIQTERGPRDAILDVPLDGTVAVCTADLADFWRRMATHYQDNSAVVAYGIMNEPHDMASSDWKFTSQQVVDAIREVDPWRWILVAGDDWSSAERFEQANGPSAWILDPADRTLYEAHCYFDRDGSGKYLLSYAAERRLDAGLDARPGKRLEAFADWCQRNGVRGFLGEFGAPSSDPDWNRLLERFVRDLSQRQLAGCGWAAGEWWGDYALSLQPTSGGVEEPEALKILTGYQ